MITTKITEATPMVDILAMAGDNNDESFEQRFAEAKDLILDLYDLQMIYSAAIKEILTKLEILNDEFVTTHARNPIHTMKSRIKTPKSVAEKLMRKGYHLDVKSARENIDDIAGIRIICPYIKDIYVIRQLLEAQDDLEIVRETDYIKAPKPNGYRSLHLIINVPVFFSDHKETVKVEIQIRTIAMDFWASLEHQLRYKAPNKKDIPEDISAELKSCADIIAQTDIRMQDIHNKVLS